MKNLWWMMVSAVFVLVMATGCDSESSSERGNDDDDDDGACEEDSDCNFGELCKDGFCSGGDPNVDGDACAEGAIICDKVNYGDTPVQVCGASGTFTSFSCEQACALYRNQMEDAAMIPDCCPCSGGDDDDDTTDDDDDTTDDDDDTTIECSEEQSCPLGYQCNLEKGECEPVDCTADADCPSGYHCEESVGICAQDTCIENPTICDSETEVCNEVNGACDPKDLELNFDPEPCDSTGGSSPVISPDTRVLDFGAVLINTRTTKSVNLCNSGGTDLAITSLQLSHTTSTEYFVASLPVPFTIEPGFQIPVYVVYSPRDNMEDDGEMNILSNDPASPGTVISLDSSIKPAPYIKVNPQVLGFAGPSSKSVEARNIGTSHTTVYELMIEGTGADQFSILECAKNGSAATAGPWRLDPNDFLMCQINYTGGDEQAILTFPWDTETTQEESTVDLIPGAAPLCAVADAGPDQIVPPLATVLLNGDASVDPDGTIVAYRWSWVSKPADAHRAIIQDMSGNSIQGAEVQTPYVQFYAELAGDYEVQLEVKDSTESCSWVNVDTVKVSAVPEETVHVQLMWTISGNDQDLHLVHPGGYHSRGDTSNTTDCHWQNCNTRNGTQAPCPPRGCPGPLTAPDWGMIGSRDDDPTLDIDNIPGTGPENINLSLPELGDYLVSVEYYSGSSNPKDIVRIWLFGVLMATFPLEWNQQNCGSSCANNHWEVSWLRVHSPSEIQIVPIGNIVPSN